MLSENQPRDPRPALKHPMLCIATTSHCFPPLRLLSLHRVTAGDGAVEAASTGKLL